LGDGRFCDILLILFPSIILYIFLSHEGMTDWRYFFGSFFFKKKNFTVFFALGHSFIQIGKVQLILWGCIYGDRCDEGNEPGPMLGTGVVAVVFFYTLYFIFYSIYSISGGFLLLPLFFIFFLLSYLWIRTVSWEFS